MAIKTLPIGVLRTSNTQIRSKFYIEYDSEFKFSFRQKFKMAAIFTIAT